MCSADVSGLDKDSVAIVSQIGPVSRGFLDPYPVGHRPGYVLTRIGHGVRVVTGVQPGVRGCRRRLSPALVTSSNRRADRRRAAPGGSCAGTAGARSEAEPG